MRTRLGVFGAGLAVLAGCAPAANVRPQTVPVPPVVDLPASAAGGACRLLDFDLVDETIGVRFDVSAASRHRDTESCVLRTEQTERPDLVLSVTKTSADTEVFTEEMVPGGGRAVKGLGKSAYQLIVAPGRDQGAAVEVGWLTGKGRLVNLRYTLGQDGDRAGAERVAVQVVALAKKLPIDLR